MKKDYTIAVRRAGVGGTPQICQDALIEMLEALFAGKKYTGQEGRKELQIIKQNLPIPKRQRDMLAYACITSPEDTDIEFNNKHYNPQKIKLKNRNDKPVKIKL